MAGFRGAAGETRITMSVRSGRVRGQTPAVAATDETAAVMDEAVSVEGRPELTGRAAPK
jgi:hypothetical protein